MAKDSKSGLKMENLEGTRNAKSTRSFYQLRQMIEYKAKLLEILIVYIDSHVPVKNVQDVD